MHSAPLLSVVTALCGALLFVATGFAATSAEPPLTLHYFDPPAQTDNPALAALLGKADAINLASNDHWLRLLHFEKKRLGRWQSIVDQPSFFLAANGKYNARDELRATLAAFFSERPLPDGLRAQCKYPARFFWLNQQLNFAEVGLPAQRCKAFEHYMQALEPSGITVIFAASHPGGPSSMFGHTLLRFDQPKQTEALKMLAYAISYAADSNAARSNPISYAVRGLAGGYPGRFSVTPYYLKMRQYSQMEDRALWEYRLKLSPQQTEMIARHSYEMSSAWSDYYFFTENCSYLLLTLIDVALPGPRVSQLMKNWVLPADSIVALEKAGLIEAVKQQPGYHQIIRAQRQLLQPSEQRLALQLAANSRFTAPEFDQLPADRQAAVLDLAYDYRRYRRIRDSNRLDAELSSAEQKLLARRAQLGGRSRQPSLPIATRPDKGHASQRAEFGLGQYGNRGFAAVGWRAAYHGLLDPQAGYRKNSRLEVLNLQARIYRQAGAQRDSQKLALQRFELFNILAIEPRDAFFKRWSWNARTDFGRTLLNRQLRSVTRLGGGAGQSLSLAENNRWVGYAMADADLEYASFLPSNYRLGIGPRLGLVGQLASLGRLHIEARHLWSAAGANEKNWSVSIGASRLLTPMLNLKFSLLRQQRFGQRNNQFLLALQRYY